MRIETVVKVVKITGTVCSIVGMLAGNWAGDKQTKLDLAKMVNDKFKHH